MNFFDLAQGRDRGFLGLGLSRRGVLLASAGVMLAGAVAVVAVPAVMRAAQPTTPEAAVPVAMTLALPRPVLARPDSAAMLLAAVAALRTDPIVVRDEPMAVAAPLPEMAPVVDAASLAVVMSTKAVPKVGTLAVAPQIVTAMPLPAAAVLAPFGAEAFAVAVLSPTAETPRPALRPVAAGGALVRPQPRPAMIQIAYAAPQRPLQRPVTADHGAQVVLASATVAAGPARPAPRPFEQPHIVVATAQAPVAMVPAPVGAVIASSAPETSPLPRSRPARVLLAAAAAREAVAATAPQRVAQVAPVVEPPKTDLDNALARAPQAADCPSQLARGIPRRSGSAASGSEFGAALGSASGTARDQMIVREVLAGNVPQFLRALTPVTLTGSSSAGKPVTITVCVTPDYVAVGDNDDFLRLPMGLPEAAQIADQMGFMLPTTRMVDAIYSQAGVRLSPRPMQAGPQMTSTSYLRQHNATIEGQTNAAGRPNGTLVAGIKKDLVLTNALRRAPGQVAIYGWHQANGRPIQPLTTVHGQHYSDYSHGVRLVSQTAYLNGRAVALADLLEDRVYAQIVSSEGPIAAPRTLLASLYTR